MGEASNHTFSGRSEKMKDRCFVVGINQGERPYLLRARTSSSYSAALVVIFLLFPGRTLSAILFSPSDRWKQLFYSCFPLELFNRSCTGESEESTTVTPQTQRKSCGLEELFRRLLSLNFIASVPVVNENEELISLNETAIAAKGI